ncbi:MAG: ATP-binding protein [Thermoplasmatales archaeon]|nr:ATP-binding protein [Thermoplasmatales archaeon]
MIVAVASGKGGTGKTSVVASFASFNNAVIADCDVDAPNLHLIFNPKIEEEISFEGMKVAEINEKCIKCGKCEKECRFKAIKNFKIISEKCEGCGVCKIVCPYEAIELKKRITGKIYVGETRFGKLVYGLLSSGEGSGKLINQIRQKANEISEKGKKPVLIDSSAGIGCPVIASIVNTDLVVIVVEPTLASIHDMHRIIEVAEYFKVKFVVIINKYDINEELTKKIEEYCIDNGIKVVGKIPFDKKFIEAMVEGKSIVEYDENFKKLMKKIWNKIEELNYL